MADFLWGTRHGDGFMKITALSALAALALAGAPAFGQTVMLNFSFPEMRQQLTDLKSTVTKEGDTEEEKIHYLEAKAESGLIYVVYGAECDSKEATQRCRGAELIATFTPGAKGDVNKALDLIDYAALADYKGSNGDLKLSRYIIFDNGITPANLKVNLEVFLSISNKVWDRLEDEGFFEK
jgi:hypothetical protein